MSIVQFKEKGKGLEGTTDLVHRLIQTISHLGLHGMTDGDVPLDGEGSQGEG